MNILKITKNQFWELEHLRKELDNPEDAVLCKCEKCGGAGWAYNKIIIGKDGYIDNEMNCPCGGRNRKVDKIEII